MVVVVVSAVIVIVGFWLRCDGCGLTWLTLLSLLAQPALLTLLTSLACMCGLRCLPLLCFLLLGVVLG